MNKTRTMRTPPHSNANDAMTGSDKGTMNSDNANRTMKKNQLTFSMNNSKVENKIPQHYILQVATPFTSLDPHPPPKGKDLSTKSSLCGFLLFFGLLLT